MNKCIAIVLLAVACEMVLANVEIDSQAPIVPSNDEEVAELDGTTQVFTDYCISTRDYLVNDVKTRRNDQAANLFRLFFNNAQEITQDALETNKQASEQLANQLANPDAPIPEGVEGYVAEGLSKIQASQVQPQSLVNAFVSNLQAVGANLMGNLMTRIRELRNGLTVTEFANALVGACDHVANYNQAFQAKFADTKTGLASVAPAVAFLKYEDVKCMTTQRVSRLEGLCNFVNVAKGPLMQTFGRA